jgi:MtfA peptidase
LVAGSNPAGVTKNKKLILDALVLLYEEISSISALKYWYISPKKLEIAKKSILEKEVSFYQKLAPKYQEAFEHRIVCFLENYTFKGQENLQVTDQMQVLIAASYVMLTFGFRKFLSESFHTILLYPRAYQSTISQDLHKGEFNPAASVVVFSWVDFLAGIITENDNLHLGIHEFAHVIHYDSKTNKSSDYRNFRFYLNQLFQEVSFPKNRDILLQSGYIREYAFTNQFEFVAVIMENFFETPLEFQKTLPPVYGKIVKMLQINPKIFR